VATEDDVIGVVGIALFGELLDHLGLVDLGRDGNKAMAINRDMMCRAWAMGAAVAPGLLTIDPDATCIDTFGKQKEGTKFSYKGNVPMSPLVGVGGETGDVLAIRARGGNVSPRRKLAGFLSAPFGAAQSATG
jgi:hypothetical protein